MKLQGRWLRVGSTVLVLVATVTLPMLPVALWVEVGVAQEVNSRKVEADRLLQQGIQQAQVSQFEAAFQSWQQALTIYREIKDRLGEGQSLGNLGIAYDALGDYAKAIAYHEQSLAIAREIKNRQGEGASLGNLGLAYYALDDYAKAMEYQQQRLAIAREIKDRLGEGQSLGNLGSAYFALGNYAKAIEYQQQRLAIARKIKDRLGEGTALGNLGSAYWALGNYAKAIEYQQQRLAIARKIKDRLGEGQSLGNLGIAYFALGNYAKAIEYQQQRLVIAREIKDRLGEGIALNNLGVALKNVNNLVRAEKILFEGIQVYESLRGQLGNNDQNKVSIFERQANTYRTLEEVLIAQNKPTIALEVSERGRARAFVELLTQRLATASKAKATDTSLTPSASSGSPSAATPPFTLAQMQQLAKAQNATLVEYSIIYDDFKIQGKQESREAALYIWVISPTGAVTFRQADLKPLWQQQNTSLKQLVTASRKGIGVRDRSDILVTANIDPTTQATRLQQLHKLLIDPIADLLPPAAQPNRPADRVIFIPQGALFLAPFPALQAANGQYLIEKYTPLTAPSIQVLTLTHQQKQNLPPSTATLVAGDPTMPRITVPGADTPLRLDPLPGAKQEAIAVAKTLNTPALTGNQASKRAIVQQMPNARIIHLATHGLLDDFKGLGVPGAIALAPDGTGQPNDGLLTADDILDLKLKADLVVLSACNTGQGKFTGDGVIGLSRSFISAGVPSVLVSLWAVPDAPTASLMTEFYRNWQERKLDKAEALRQAMLTTRQTHPNPRDWAAFTLIGEAE
jgi:CHAT domain-containing protein